MALALVSVHPVVRGAAAVGALSLASFIWGVTPRDVPPPRAAPTVRTPAALTSLPCGPREFPEGAVCVPLPSADVAEDERALHAPDAPLIPRMPDRPKDLASLEIPLEGPPDVLHGWDPPVVDARGTPLELSVELAAGRGEGVRVVRLDAQVGDATVVAIGRHVGNTVVTRHDVGDPPRVVLLVHGRLDAVAPELAVGGRVRDGDLLGFAGDSGDPGVVRLFLQARLVREGVTLDARDLRALVDAATSTPTDLRNVLAPPP